MMNQITNYFPRLPNRGNIKPGDVLGEDEERSKFFVSEEGKLKKMKMEWEESEMEIETN